MTRIKKKILILGSNGFFGKNFKKLLNRDKYEIVCLDKTMIDFIDCTALKIFFKQASPNVVIHCAGIVGSSELNKYNNQFDILNNNIIINSNILNCCTSINVDKVFIFYTYRMISDNVVENYDEIGLNYSMETSHHNYGYLLSKNILQQQIKLYNKYEKNKIICFILPNVYGPCDKFSSNGRIIPSLICKIHDAIANNTNVQINCNEKTKVNLIYINDIIQIVENCINNELSGDLIIFNKQNVMTLQEVSSHIKQLMNFQNDFLFQNELPFIDSNIMKPNISKFERHFSGFQYTDLLSSLQETIDFYSSTINN